MYIGNHELTLTFSFRAEPQYEGFILVFFFPFHLPFPAVRNLVLILLNLFT